MYQLTLAKIVHYALKFLYKPHMDIEKVCALFFCLKNDEPLVRPVESMRFDSNVSFRRCMYTGYRLADDSLKKFVWNIKLDFQLRWNMTLSGGSENIRQLFKWQYNHQTFYRFWTK